MAKANTLNNLDRYEKALTAYKRAIELDPNFADTYNGQANTLYDLNLPFN